MCPIKSKQLQTNEKIYAIFPNCLIDSSKAAMERLQERKGASRNLKD